MEIQIFGSGFRIRHRRNTILNIHELFHLQYGLKLHTRKKDKPRDEIENFTFTQLVFLIGLLCCHILCQRSKSNGHQIFHFSI